MTEPISVVVLSTGLDNFKDIRRALSAEQRVKLLAGGNDADQLYDEIVRLKPQTAIMKPITTVRCFMSIMSWIWRCCVFPE